MQERNGEILLRFLRSLSSPTDHHKKLQANSGSESGSESEIESKPTASNFHEVLKLQNEKSECPQHNLFLLGDIFDIWVSDHTVFVKEYLPLIEEIQMLLQKNFRIIYFEGNHDMHIDRFWTEQLGVEVYDEAAFFKIGNLEIRAEHGDLINLNDEKHLRSRRILRHPVMEFMGHHLPGLFWQWLAKKYSQKSRARSTHYRQQNQEEIRQMIRDHALKSYSERHFDYIISGHMHVFDDFIFSREGRPIRSINLGSWLEEPRVLQITQKHPESAPEVQWIDPARL